MSRPAQLSSGQQLKPSASSSSTTSSGTLSSSSSASKGISSNSENQRPLFSTDSRAFPSAPRPLGQASPNLPFGYVPNKSKAYIPSALFAPDLSSSSAAKKDKKPRPADDGGETFDLPTQPMTAEDYEVAQDADKHMRELLEGALGEDVEVDVSGLPSRASPRPVSLRTH